MIITVPPYKSQHLAEPVQVNILVHSSGRVSESSPITFKQGKSHNPHQRDYQLWTAPASTPHSCPESIFGLIAVILTVHEITLPKMASFVVFQITVNIV